MHAESFGPWQHVYYFHGVGWEHPAERPLEAVADKLFTPGEHQPVLLTRDDYTRVERSLGAAGPDALRGLRAIPRVALDGDRLLLLPGAYAVCASDAVHER
jgi:hypothetical protein